MTKLNSLFGAIRGVRLRIGAGVTVFGMGAMVLQMAAQIAKLVEASFVVVSTKNQVETRVSISLNTKGSSGQPK